ncbi:hypothetical protein AvCA_14430 [Azotobacter vinelandii CA]|uniref:Uncharacterized protein n=2 Tax=Azotobacter vinelandii TaxID=354 RepID=C1DQY6_AZOVD|nr:hypothetical protein Avin_14430 [Azotobacter vinelandii DJ]AGK17000.1 hypothetical protein AvCA_14430 [Azotobacter vinelandii CA]AGK19914.1 hypothetical protein AvCA6_14430 [Azotobacter vinelandii CA6]
MGKGWRTRKLQGESSVSPLASLPETGPDRVRQGTTRGRWSFPCQRLQRRMACPGHPRRNGPASAQRRVARHSFIWNDQTSALASCPAPRQAPSQRGK